MSVSPAPFGCAVIGSGNIARLHAHAISEASGTRLVAIAGRNATTTAALAGSFGVAAGTVDGVLARPDVDVVTICTPSGTHAELGLAAARAGKHVLVEKPIDVSVERGRALVDGCRAAGVALGVIFQNRFLPAVELIQRAIAGGRFGRLLVIDGYVKWYRAPAYYANVPWRGTRALDGGGALMNQAIHTVDLLRLFAGPVASVAGMTARLRHPGIECEDTALALLRYAGGAVGVLEAATSIAPGFSRRIELHGEHGSVTLDGDDITHWSLPPSRDDAELERLQSERRARSDGSANPMNLDTGPHRRQIEDFCAALRAGRRAAVDGEEGLHAVAIAEAIYRAAETGRTVELDSTVG